MQTEHPSPRFTDIDLWEPSDVLEAMIGGQFAAVAAVRTALPEIRMVQSVASAAVAIALFWVPATEAASPHEGLIGATVYAADGVEVGHVADISTTGNRIDALRVSRGVPLGFGERFVIIPQPAFMIRGKRVVLPDLRAEDVDLFPDASTLTPETAAQDR